MNAVKVDLQADGALWAINRTVFHPRGFALAITPETGELTLLGDGSEPWDYALNTPGSVDQDEKFLAFEALLRRAREENTP